MVVAPNTMPILRAVILKLLVKKAFNLELLIEFPNDLLLFNFNENNNIKKIFLML